MKRFLPVLTVLIVLAAVGVSPAAAQESLRQGGYDVATRKLEAGFKIVSTKRVFADNECYPSSDEIAAELRQGMGIPVVVAPSLDSVQGFELVNVVSGETACNRLVLAIRAGPKGRVFVLDSDYGPVYVQGGQGLSEASVAGSAGPLRDLTAGTGVATLHRADSKARFAVQCPGGTSPLGGGWVNTAPLGGDGEGLYSHSYERLGVQGGFHVTAVYVDRSRPDTPTRSAQIQVVCGHGLVPSASPHATTFVRRHDSGTVTAHCPSGTRLFSGGFQRTNFATPEFATRGIFYGGNYITESRAVGNGWRVSAGSTGANGGELTAIAYCGEDPSLPITTVSASAHVGEGESASAVTPNCPPGRTLIAGGFDSGGSHNALIANGFFTGAGTWAATGYGWFGSADVTAYGYCAKARDTADRSGFPADPPTRSDSGHTVLYVVAGTVALIVIALFLRRRQVVRRRRRRTRAAS